MPEVWRHENGRLLIHLLTNDLSYQDSTSSKAFPFLPMDALSDFVGEMIHGDETLVLRRFVQWVRSLP